MHKNIYVYNIHVLLFWNTHYNYADTVPSPDNSVLLLKYLCRHIHFWDMAEPIKQRVAVHCFENLVQFLNLQKFNTDWKSVAWRKLFLNICLSGIDELGLKRVDLAAVFSLQPRTLNDYRTALSVMKYSSQNHK